MTAPQKKPGTDAAAEEAAAWEAARKGQFSRRIPVKDANAEHKQWRPIKRYIERREYYNETHLAVAGLVCAQTAMR